MKPITAMRDSALSAVGSSVQDWTPVNTVIVAAVDTAPAMPPRKNRKQTLRARLKGSPVITLKK
jgi:hypothetical protein